MTEKDSGKSGKPRDHLRIVKPDDKPVPEFTPPDTGLTYGLAALRAGLQSAANVTPIPSNRKEELRHSLSRTSLRILKSEQDLSGAAVHYATAFRQGLGIVEAITGPLNGDASSFTDAFTEAAEGESDDLKKARVIVACSGLGLVAHALRQGAGMGGGEAYRAATDRNGDWYGVDIALITTGSLLAQAAITELWTSNGQRIHDDRTADALDALAADLAQQVGVANSQFDATSQFELSSDFVGAWQTVLDNANQG